MKAKAINTYCVKRRKGNMESRRIFFKFSQDNSFFMTQTNEGVVRILVYLKYHEIDVIIRRNKM